jgi:hypothetical protein
MSKCNPCRVWSGMQKAWQGFLHPSLPSGLRVQPAAGKWALWYLSSFSVLSLGLVDFIIQATFLKVGSGMSHPGLNTFTAAHYLGPAHPVGTCLYISRQTFLSTCDSNLTSQHSSARYIFSKHTREPNHTVAPDLAYNIPTVRRSQSF